MSPGHAAQFKKAIAKQASNLPWHVGADFCERFAGVLGRIAAGGFCLDRHVSISFLFHTFL